MSAFDLTTVAAVKTRLGLPVTPTSSDPTIANLATAASRAIYAALSRTSLLPQMHSDTIDLESDRVYLSNWPVQQVTTVTLDGLPIPPAVANNGPPTMGYLLKPADVAPPGRPQALDLFGIARPRRRQSLIVAYQAGYAVFGEAWNGPSLSPFLITAAQPYGPWASDLGVTYVNSGQPLQPVTNAPAAGQYMVTNGVYQFSSADAGAALALSYGFVPQDLAQAATELAAERFRSADRIGLRSKTLGGQETISYDLSGVSAAVEALIAPYRRTAF